LNRLIVSLFLPKLRELAHDLSPELCHGDFKPACGQRKLGAFRATPDEIRAIATMLGPRGRKAGIREA